MFCGKCGANISSGSRKCPNCGTPAKNIEFLGGFQDILRTDVSSMQAFRPQGYAAPVQPVIEPKKNNILLYIAAGIAAVSLLANLFFGILLLKKNKAFSDLDTAAAEKEAEIESMESEIKRLESEIEELSHTPEPVPADSITGFVYLDTDQDGVYNSAADMPYADLKVELYIFDDLNSAGSYTLAADTKTDQNGNYTFSSLKEGMYRIVFKAGDMHMTSGGIEENITIPAAENEKYMTGFARESKNKSDD